MVKNKKYRAMPDNRGLKVDKNLILSVCGDHIQQL